MFALSIVGFVTIALIALRAWLAPVSSASFADLADVERLQRLSDDPSGIAKLRSGAEADPVTAAVLRGGVLR